MDCRRQVRGGAGSAEGRQPRMRRTGSSVRRRHVEKARNRLRAVFRPRPLARRPGHGETLRRRRRHRGRADEFLDQGIIDGERLWVRIMQAIEELQRKQPRDGEAVH